MRSALLTLACAVVLCAACSRGRVFDAYRHTSLSGWEKADTLAYDVPRLKAGGDYATALGLRVGSTFPFVSMTLVVDQTIYPGGRVFSDTVLCRITNDKGHALGSGIGFYQYHYPVSLLRLKEGDSLHITVRHIMRREIMPGVSDVGIALRRVR